MYIIHVVAAVRCDGHHSLCGYVHVITTTTLSCDHHHHCSAVCFCSRHSQQSYHCTELHDALRAESLPQYLVDTQFTTVAVDTSCQFMLSAYSSASGPFARSHTAHNARFSTSRPVWGESFCFLCRVRSAR
eukprot:scpid81033/ scgid21205/ 